VAVITLAGDRRAEPPRASSTTPWLPNRCFPDPKILAPTGAVIRTVAACVCGSDLWDYRGEVAQPTPIGHEYVGVVEETGSEVRDIKPGPFVIGSFFASDNTCPVCHAGCQTSCAHKEFVGCCQAEYIRIPLADGTLVASRTPPTTWSARCRHRPRPGFGGRRFPRPCEPRLRDRR
jgi:threonine dehydrogenase-like Zn-dependent dehydrogenase